MRVRRLPGERFQSLSVVGSVCCSSCCCCCCCLHSVGGLVGAALGSVYAVVPKAVDAATLDPKQPRAEVAGARDGATISVLLHWVIGFALIVATVLVFALADIHDGVWIGLGVVVVFGPVLQFWTLVLGLLAVPVVPVGKAAALKAVGKIALFSLIGSVIGGVLLTLVIVLVVALK